MWLMLTIRSSRRFSTNRTYCGIISIMCDPQNLLASRDSRSIYNYVNHISITPADPPPARREVVRTNAALFSFIFGSSLANEREIEGPRERSRRQGESYGTSASLCRGSFIGDGNGRGERPYRGQC